MYKPAEKIIEHNFGKLGLILSAILPPMWYPKVKPANMTPIKLPQVYIELPNTGINNLLAENSNDIVTTPEIKTKAVRTKENFLLPEMIKIGPQLQIPFILYFLSVCRLVV